MIDNCLPSTGILIHPTYLRTGSLICVLPNAPLIYYPDTLNLQVRTAIHYTITILYLPGTRSLPSIQDCSDVWSPDCELRASVCNTWTDSRHLGLLLPYLTLLLRILNCFACVLLLYIITYVLTYISYSLFSKYK